MQSSRLFVKHKCTGVQGRCGHRDSVPPHPWLPLRIPEELIGCPTFQTNPILPPASNTAMPEKLVLHSAREKRKILGNIFLYLPVSHLTTNSLLQVWWENRGVPLASAGCSTLPASITLQPCSSSSASLVAPPCFTTMCWAPPAGILEVSSSRHFLECCFQQP